MTATFFRTTILAAVAAFGLNAAAQAQTRIEYVRPVERAPVAPAAPGTIQDEIPNTGTVERGLVNGIARGGLEMVSPFAPAYYGDGRAYVSTYAREESKRNAYTGQDETGKPKGLKFVSMEW